MATDTAETKGQAPTLEDVGVMGTRLAALELEADALGERYESTRFAAEGERALERRGL